MMLAAMHIGAVALWMLLAQDPEVDVRTHYGAAKEAQQAGDLNKAADEYRAVVRLAPQLAEAHLNLGLLCHALGALEESARELEKAEQLKPGLIGASLYLGIDYVRLNQPERAVPLLRKAVEQEPARKEARSWLASALWDAGRRQPALIELENAAAAFPADIDVLFLLGEGYRKAATALVDEIVAGAKGSPLVHQVLAESYAAHGEWDRSARHYERLLRKSPQYPGARLGLIAALIGQGKAEEAARQYRQLSAGPLPPAARHIEAALTALQAGHAEGSARELELFVESLPGRAGAGFSPAWALFERRDYAGVVRELRQPNPGGNEKYLLARCYEHLAVRTLEEMAALDPGSYRVHQLMAQIAETQQDNEKALAEYRMVETLRPTLAGLHFAMGRLLWRQERLDEALAELRKELALNPNHVEANAEAGTIYVRQQEAQKGIPYLERAVKLQPGLLEARKQLGKGYSLIRRYREAEQQLKLALPGDVDGSTYYILGNVYRQMGQTKDAAKALETARRIKAQRLAEVMITEKPTEQ
jgi:tetratricopeptide (TPR) repeat protein